MKLIIKIISKSVYGKELVYIISEQKESISMLTGRKSLSKDDIIALKKMGFKFELMIDNKEIKSKFNI